MKRFGAALLLLMGLLFGCTVLTGLDREYVLDTASSSGSTGGSVDSSCEPGTKRDCYPGPEGTKNVGLCKAGEQVCDELGTAYGPCEGAVLPSTEVCGQDEDANCDGELTCSEKAIWSHLFGSVADQMGVSVAIDSGGNTLLAGHFTGNINLGGERLVSVGGYDVFVAKLDPTGKHLWSQRFGGAADDRCSGVDVDGADNVVLTGAFESTINFGSETLINAGGHDVFVVKLDPAAGKYVWSKRAGDGANQDGYGIAVNRVDDSIVVTGAFESLIDFGNAPLNNLADGFDAFVVKLNASGEQVWIKQFGDAKDQRGSKVAVNGAGDIALTGVFDGVIDLGGETLTSAGSDDVFVAKLLSADGSHLWSKGFGDAASQVSTGVAFDSGGNVVLAGYFAGTVDFGNGLPTSADDLDVFVVKLAPNGAYVWSEQYGGAGSQRANSLAVDKWDNIVLTGAFAESIDFGSDPLVSAGDLDVFVAKLAANGAYVWSKRFGSPLDQTGEGVAVDRKAGDVVLTGSYKGSVDLGGGPSPVAGGLDMFTARFNALGKPVWGKSYRDAGEHVGKSIAVDGKGDVVLTGYLQDSINLGGMELPGAGGEDVLLVKLSSDGKLLWGKPFGYAGLQYGTSVNIDGMGNIVLAGYFTGSIDFGGGSLISTGGSYNIFVAKFSSDGIHIWSKQFGSAWNEQVMDAAIDSSDNIVLTGVHDGELKFGKEILLPDVDGNYDIFVAKLSPEGTPIWSKSYGGQDHQHGVNVAIGSADEIVLGGYFRGTLNFGDNPSTSLPTAEGPDGFVAKLSADGDHLWSKSFGGPDDQHVFDVTVDEGGEIVLTGDYKGTVNLGGEWFNSKGATDVFIAKLHANGEHQWSKSFGNSLDQHGSGVAIDSASNIVLAGRTIDGFKAGSDTPFSGGGKSDVFVVKFAANGDHIWSKGFGDGADQAGIEVAVDSAGNALLTGYTTGRIDFGNGLLTSTGSFDVFVAKLAP